MTLPPPMAEHGLDTHLYVSHTWKHAQEQCAVIRWEAYPTPTPNPNPNPNPYP